MKLTQSQRLLSAAALIFLSTTALAAHHQNYKGEVAPVTLCRTLCPLKDGIYVGVGAGYNTYRVRESVDRVATTGEVVITNPTINVDGWLGNIFLGYGRYFGWFYIAGEIFGNYSGISANYSSENYRSSFAVRESYGASIIPGVSVNKAVLMYGRIGYQRNFFKSEESLPSATTVSATHWGNGLNYGLGIETVIYKNVSVRGEYTFAHYDSFKAQSKSSFSPASGQFILSALYHFDYL